MHLTRELVVPSHTTLTPLPTPNAIGVSVDRPQSRVMAGARCTRTAHLASTAPAGSSSELAGDECELACDVPMLGDDGSTACARRQHVASESRFCEQSARQRSSGDQHGADAARLAHGAGEVAS